MANRQKDGLRRFQMVRDGLRKYKKTKDKKSKTIGQRHKDKVKKTKMQKTKRRSEIVGEGFRWSEMV